MHEAEGVGGGLRLSPQHHARWAVDCEPPPQVMGKVRKPQVMECGGGTERGDEALPSRASAHGDTTQEDERASTCRRSGDVEPRGHGQRRLDVELLLGLHHQAASFLDCGTHKACRICVERGDGGGMDQQVDDRIGTEGENEDEDHGRRVAVVVSMGMVVAMLAMMQLPDLPAARARAEPGGS